VGGNLWWPLDHRSDTVILFSWSFDSLTQTTTSPPPHDRNPHRQMHGPDAGDCAPAERDKSSPGWSTYLSGARNTPSDGRPAQLQRKLLQEMQSHIKATECRFPSATGDGVYYVRTVEGSQYAESLRSLATGARVRRVAAGRDWADVNQRARVSVMAWRNGDERARWVPLATLRQTGFRRTRCMFAIEDRKRTAGYGGRGWGR